MSNFVDSVTEKPSLEEIMGDIEKDTSSFLRDDYPKESRIAILEEVLRRSGVEVPGKLEDKLFEIFDSTREGTQTPDEARIAAQKEVGKINSVLDKHFGREIGV